MRIRAHLSAIALLLLLILRLGVGLLFIFHTAIEFFYRLQRRGGAALIIDGTAAWEPIVVFILMIISTIHGVPLLMRQLVCTAKVRRWVTIYAQPSSERVLSIAREIGYTGRIIEVAAPGPMAFTVGLLRPRIVVSSGLIELMSRDELVAVLLHEVHHAKCLDPLRAFAIRGLADLLWWCPILRNVAERQATRSELAADRNAICRLGAKPLIRALSKLTAPTAAPVGVLAAVHREGIGARVSQLEDGREPQLRLASRGRIAVSGVTIGVVFVLCAVSIYVYGTAGLYELLYGR